MDLKEYEQKVEEEEKIFNPNLYNENLIEIAGSGLTYLLDKFQERVREQIGKNVWDYTVDAVNNVSNNNDEVKILSLGSGPGGLEMNLAEKFRVKYYMKCIDINKKMLEIGQNKSDTRNLNIEFSYQDINYLDLKNEKYDIIFAHASLHHLINHEHVIQEVKKSMKCNAQFIVYEVTYRNRMKMWDETKKVVDKVWHTIPKRYRYEKKPLIKKLINRLFPNLEVNTDGFECIRSEDLYKILKQNFTVKIEVPGFSFARHFVDHPFQENYDIDNTEDKKIIDNIIKLDEEYTNSLKLKPESVFFVLKK